MQKLGYGPDKRLALKVSTRNIPPYRDPAVILTELRDLVAGKMSPAQIAEAQMLAREWKPI
jgi:hypothetical protein